MNMKCIQRFSSAIVVILVMFALANPAVAADKEDHHNGKELLGEKIKTNGHHAIDKKGDYTTSVEVKDGRVAGVHVKHAKKGDVPVKKYKTNKNMAQAAGHRFTSFLSQDQYLGTTWIGYAYVDDYGVETIYWFPYDMILDGDTGAIEYVPAQQAS
jgi:ribosomal protein L21